MGISGRCRKDRLHAGFTHRKANIGGIMLGRGRLIVLLPPRMYHASKHGAGRCLVDRCYVSTASIGGSNAAYKVPAS